VCERVCERVCVREWRSLEPHNLASVDALRWSFAKHLGEGGVRAAFVSLNFRAGKIKGVAS